MKKFYIRTIRVDAKNIPKFKKLLERRGEKFNPWLEKKIKEELE